ncbi:MAG TPA: lipoyl(octanoyl) transferase LipB [Actinomycetota bacterium]
MQMVNQVDGSGTGTAGARAAWLIRPPGLVPYADANSFMHDMAERRAAGEVPDSLILLEHPPVFTAGRRSRPDHVRWAAERFGLEGATFEHVDRGGSVTFHGPGQLVGYPVLDLGVKPDVIAHLRRIEEAIILAAGDIGIGLHRDPGATGVWSGDRKVCAIGVKLTHARVTLHGFALNCTTDLAWFDAIVPCGLADRGVVTLSELAGREVTVAEMAPIVERRFAEVFGVRFAPAPEDLEIAAVVSLR